MDSLKKAASDSLATAKFDGVHVHVTQTPDKRLTVSVEASGSIDLPGDLDAIVAQAATLLGLGNSSPASPAP